MFLGTLAQFAKQYKERGLSFLFGVVLGLLLLAILFVLNAGVLMWAWNAALVPIFGVHSITFWPALGLCVLEFSLRATMKTWRRDWHTAVTTAPTDAAKH